MQAGAQNGDSGVTGTAGGNGGNAAATLGGLSLVNGSQMIVAAGAGGAGASVGQGGLAESLLYTQASA